MHGMWWTKGEAAPAPAPAWLARWAVSCGSGPWPQQPGGGGWDCSSAGPPLLGAFSRAFVEISVQGQPGSESPPVRALDWLLTLTWLSAPSDTIQSAKLSPFPGGSRTVGVCAVPLKPLSCLSILAGVLGRQGQASPYTSLCTCTKEREVNNCPLALGDLTGLLFARALTPTSPCCWAGGFRWKSTCEVRMLLSAWSSVVGMTGREGLCRWVGKSRLFHFREPIPGFSPDIHISSCPLDDGLLMMDLEDSGINFHPCLESLCPM